MMYEGLGPAWQAVELSVGEQKAAGLSGGWWGCRLMFPRATDLGFYRSEFSCARARREWGVVGCRLRSPELIDLAFIDLLKHYSLRRDGLCLGRWV